jgi:hypothetical protein
MEVLKNRFMISVILTSSLLFVFAFFRVHILINTTELGYQIAKLKDREEVLLERQSELAMKIAKVTSRSHLSVMSGLPVEDLKSKGGKIAAR